MEHPHTYHSLQKWYEYAFKKLGWMILAYHHNNLEKVSNYITSVEKLKASLYTKLNETKDQDRKNDIQIMHDNVLILLSHLYQDFCTQM